MKNFLALVAITLSVCHLTAQTTQPIQYRVRLNINMEQESSFESRLVSSMKRELRALGNVMVVESEPSYGIRIVGMELQTMNASPLGSFALAVEFEQYFNVAKMKDYLANKIGAEAQQKNYAYAQLKETLEADIDMRTIPDQGALFRNLLVFTSSMEGIDRTSRDIVAKFDKQCLQPSTESNQHMQDQMKNPNASPEPKEPETQPLPQQSQ